MPGLTWNATGATTPVIVLIERLLQKNSMKNVKAA
jgi:hypothetical protein